MKQKIFLAAGDRRSYDNNPSLAFIIGILIGISLVLNLAFLQRTKRNDR